MKKLLSLNFITSGSVWLTIIFPFLIAAGKGPAEIGTILLAVFFLIHVISKKDFKFLKEKWVIVSLILWIYLVIRSVFTPDIKHALAKSFPFIRFILLAACIEFLPQKDNKINPKILMSVFIVLTFLVLDGFIQLFVGYDLFGRPIVGSIDNYFRLTGPFSKQILGTTIATLGIIGIAGMIPLLKKYKNYSLLIFFSTASICTIVFLSGERAALLRLIFSITVLWLALFLKAKDFQTKKNFWISGLLLFLLCVILIKFFVLFAPGSLDRQLTSSIKEVKHSSSSSYIFLWKTGIDAGFTNILFGIGPNQFELYCQAHPHATLPICGNNQMFFHPHNIWIEFFAESGLVGLSLFLSIVYILTKKLIKFLTTCHNLFEWEGKLCEEKECILIMKTVEKNFTAIKNKVQNLHSYSCPCVLMLPIANGNENFLNWISETCK